MNGLAMAAGLGGLELGLHLALGKRYQTVCYIENDLAKVEFLKQRFGDGLDPAPIWDDISTFDGRHWRGVVDIVSAGLPCRPYSSAARGRNKPAALWDAALRIIGECCPSLVFLENVTDARKDLRLVCDALRSLDYCVLPPLEISAASVGAPYIGRRIFILAAAHEKSESTLPLDDEVAGESHTTRGWWDEIDRVRDMDDGLPGRLAEVGALGDAVVPLVAAHALRTLAARLLK